MTYHAKLDQPWFQVTFTGVLTGGDLHAVDAELRAREHELGRVPDRLVDMSGMEATSATFNLAILAARVRSVRRFPNSFRSAIVAPKVEVAGFVWIFRALHRNPQIEVRLFEDRDAAAAWLDSSRDE